VSAIFNDIDVSFSLSVECIKQSVFDALNITNWLSEEEQTRYKQLQISAVTKRSRQWLLGRYAAKSACRRWLEEQGLPVVEWRDIEIGNSESGMPFITIQGIEEAPTISIAHSGNEAIAVIAAPGHPVGVDIESRTPRTNLHALAERICSEAEFNRWFTSVKDVELPDRFRALWLAKEAVAKCGGKGLQWQPGMFEVVGLDEDSAEVSYGENQYAVAMARTAEGMAAIAWLTCISQDYSSK
jgi:phosphopantetheinyl transferase